MVNYSVEHYQENMENDEFTKLEEEIKTGEAGTNTSAEPKEYDGFIVQSFIQVPISADGSTVIQIQYKRKRTSLILNLNGGTSSTTLKNGENGRQLLEGKVGAKVEVKGLKKENLGFKKWEPDLPEFFPKENDGKIYVAQWSELIRLSIKGDDGVIVANNAMLNVGKGAKWKVIKTDAQSKIELKEYFDFTGWHLGTADGLILQDDTEFMDDAIVFASSVRPKFAITVEGDEGISLKDATPIPVDKGEQWKDIKVKAQNKVGILNENFEFVAWHLEDANGNILENEYRFMEDTIIFVTSKRKVVQYKVEHLQENIENDEFTKLDEEIKTGEAGTNTSATARQYKGFKNLDVEQQEISVDGNTVVQIKYKREIVSLFFDLKGGSTTTSLENVDGKKLLEGKVGAKVEVNEPVKENANFEKWEPSLPEFFAQSDDKKIYVAKWKKSKAKIIIKGDERLDIIDPGYIEVPLNTKKPLLILKVMLIVSVI